MRGHIIGALAAALCASCGGQVDEAESTWPKTGCPPGTELVGGRCQVREVFVPGGTFVMGRGDCAVAGVHQVPPDFNDCPLADAPHEVFVAPFWIEATALTRAHGQDDPDCPSQELECAKESAYFPFTGSVDIAMPNFDGPGSLSPGDQACAKEGKRHITEAQWEWAATWGGTRTYPWGENEPTCELANIDPTRCKPKVPYSAIPELSAAGSYPPSPEGIYDLIGNAGEVVGVSPDAYTGGYTALPTTPTKCPPGEKCPWAKGIVLPVRGGEARAPAHVFRATHRGIGRIKNDIPGHHFRCVRAAE
jgi:formylglycine-generating enzyme required for sulfatase activity